MKKFNRIAAFLLALVITFAMLPVTQADAADPFTGSYTYDVEGSDGYFTGGAVDGTPGEIAVGDEFKLTLGWSTANYKPGGSYTFSTAPGFIIYDSGYTSTNFSGALLDMNNEENGSFSVAYDAANKCSIVTISFDDDFADTATGGLTLYGRFDNPNDADPDNNGIIEVPGDGNYPIYTPDAPEQTHDVDVYKSGTRKEKNGEIYFHYVVSVYAQDGALTNVNVLDTPDSGLRINTDSVYLSNSSYESVYGGTTLETTQVPGNNGTTAYQWIIPSVPDHEYRYIHYDAEIVDDQKTSFDNFVTATAGSKSDTDTETVTLRSPDVFKEGVVNGLTVTWTITVNFNDYGSVQLKEYNSNNYAFDRIMNQAQNNNAQFLVTYKPSNRQETYSYSAYKSGLSLVKQEGETSAVVTFDTILSDKYANDNNELDNVVEYKYGNKTDNEYATVQLIKTPRIKSKTGVDLAANYTENNYYGGKPEIQWTIELSFSDKPSNLYTIPRFADYLQGTQSEYNLAGALNHQYVEDSFVLVHENTEYTQDNWSEFIERLVFTKIGEGVEDDFLRDIQGATGGHVWPWEGTRAFVIEFADSAPKGNYILKYKTSYEPAYVQYANDPLRNAFLANNDEYITSNVDVVLNYIRKSAVELSSNSTPNVTGSEVKWFISLEPTNYYLDTNKDTYFADSGPVTVADTLPEGFVVKSVTLVDKSGTRQEFPKVIEEYGYIDTSENAYYTVDGQQLEIVIGTGETVVGEGRLCTGSYLEIVTEYTDYNNLTPGVKFGPYTNNANFTINDITYPDVTADVYITPPALITKSISYKRENAPRPEFTIEVNPNGQDLMRDSDTITVSDKILDSNQTVIANTVKVYEGIGSAKTLVDSSKYQVVVNAAKTEFTITGLKDATAYTIQYRTYVDVAYDSTVKFDLINRAYLDGIKRDMNGDGKVDVNEFVYAECKWNDKVVIPSAFNNLDMYKPYVYIDKIDAITGENLSGAEFTIYDQNNNVVGTISGADGNYNNFQIKDLNCTYTMKETKAPEGYVLSEQVWKFGRYTNVTCPPGVDNLDGLSLKIYQIENTPAVKETSLTIYKNGGKSDENFIMTVTGTDGLSMQVVVPANGSVTIDGLTVGETYTVVEDAAWAWRYTFNSGSDTLEIDPAENSVTINNALNIRKWLSGDSVAENRWTFTQRIR